MTKEQGCDEIKCSLKTFKVASIIGYTNEEKKLHMNSSMKLIKEKKIHVALGFVKFKVIAVVKVLAICKKEHISADLYHTDSTVSLE